MNAIAIVVLVLTVASVANGPFTFGKTKNPLTPGVWLASSAINMALLIPLCGRVLGWW